MLTRLDGEIRELEARIVRERRALRELTADCSATLRDRAVSPKSLAAIAAVGFFAAELLHPARALRRGGKTGLLAAVVERRNSAAPLAVWLMGDLTDHPTVARPPRCPSILGLSAGFRVAPRPCFAALIRKEVLPLRR